MKKIVFLVLFIIFLSTSVAADNRITVPMYVIMPTTATIVGIDIEKPEGLIDGLIGKSLTTYYFTINLSLEGFNLTDSYLYVEERDNKVNMSYHLTNDNIEELNRLKKTSLIVPLSFDKESSYTLLFKLNYIPNYNELPLKIQNISYEQHEQNFNTSKVMQTYSLEIVSPSEYFKIKSLKDDLKLKEDELQEQRHFSKFSLTIAFITLFINGIALIYSTYSGNNHNKDFNKKMDELVLTLKSRNIKKIAGSSAS